MGSFGLACPAVPSKTFMEESMHAMFNRCLRGLLVVALGAAFLTGCKTTKKPDFYGELPEGEVALRKLDPSEYPDFSVNMTDPDSLIRSCDMSISYMLKPSSQRYYPYLDIPHDRAISSINALKAIALDMKANPRSSEYLNGIIRQMFDVYVSKGAPKPEGPGYTETVLFTGYFTPIYEASLTKTEQFKYPLYKRPADLVTDAATGEVKGRQTPGGGVVPYYTRKEIEGKGVLAGQEIAYVKTAWEAYTITIQGSARLRLPDGQLMEIGWDGYNGYEYSSPGEQMLKDGVIAREQYNAKGLRAYFEQNPAMMEKYLWRNDRYVFFKGTAGGPFGALGVPVTSSATIAVDKKHDPKKNIYPRAMPAFLTVPVPSGVADETKDFRGFMMDQDTGGAIRAAGRCDIYMGIGEEAEKLAGQELHEGKLYYIAVKPEYIAKYFIAPAATPASPALKK